MNAEITNQITPEQIAGTGFPSRSNRLLVSRSVSHIEWTNLLESHGIQLILVVVLLLPRRLAFLVYRLAILGGNISSECCWIIQVAARDEIFPRRLYLRQGFAFLLCIRLLRRLNCFRSLPHSSEKSRAQGVESTSREDFSP